MRVLITGSSGQLGKALVRNGSNKFNLILPDRKALDLSNGNHVDLS